MPTSLSPDDFPANPLEKQGYTLDFHDEFEGPILDTTKWLPFYLPHWSSRERSKPNYTSAWQSVFDLAQLQPGERVLIHGAGGNVGAMAVQLAKDLGAYVIASDLPEKTDLLQQLGADEIINAQTEKFEDRVGTVDVVLNFATDALVERSYSVLQPGGRYVTTLQQADQEEAERRGIRSLAAFAQPSVENLSKLAELIDAGKVKVWVQRTYPLDEAQAALEHRQTTNVPGKVVLTVE